MKRLSKEIDLNISDKFRVCYGTTNRIEPNVIYTEIKCWVGTNSDVDSELDIKFLCQKLKKFLYDNILSINKFDRKFIFDVDTSTSPQNKSQKHFLTISAFFKQKTPCEAFNDLNQPLCNLLTQPLQTFERILLDNGLIVSKDK